MLCTTSPVSFPLKVTSPGVSAEPYTELALAMEAVIPNGVTV